MLARVCFAVALLLTSSLALADGKLGYSLQSGNHFYRMDVTEQNGVQEGYELGNGSNPLYSTIQGDTLIFNVGNEEMKLLIHKNGNATYYDGLLWHKPATIVVKEDKNGFVVDATVGTNTARVDVSSKKKILNMHFLNLNLSLNKPRKGDPGDCEGRVTGPQGEDIAKIHCNSSGSLEDSFFKNSVDVVTWWIGLQLPPESQN